MEQSDWFGVRCLFKFDRDPIPIYEERVTVWKAAGADEAIGLAESEAADYVQDIDGEYLGLAQVYTMVNEPKHGAEVFSLMRASQLAEAQYLDTFFDTGAEHQAVAES